jgi:alkylhydroperoxidase family enzyme
MTRVGDVFTAALKRLPPEKQAVAGEVAIRTAAGYGTIEIGSTLGLTWVSVNRIRHETANAVVAELRASGYTETETIRLLGVPTAQVHAARAFMTETRNDGPKAA